MLLPWRPHLLAFIASRAHLHLFLDFDGTLTPIMPHPDDAWLAPPTHALLGRVLLRPHTRVTLVSGRHLDGLRARADFDPLALDLVGSHGMEWRLGGVDGTDPIALAAVPTMARIADAIAEAVAASPGAALEQKRYSLSLHVRAATAERQRVLHDVLRLAVATEPTTEIVAGKGVFEVRPVGAPHKGAGIMRVLAAAHGATWRETCAAVFIGDDRTDEDGFVALAKDGAGVRVQDGVERASAARYCTVSVDDTLALLASLCSTTGAATTG